VNSPNPLWPNFSSRLCQQGVLNKDSTVWLDDARPANTVISPPFTVNAPTYPCGVLTSKNTFASIKKLEKFGEITFYKQQKYKEEFDKLTFGNIEFAECKI
jgi:hypothetical protein